MDLGIIFLLKNKWKGSIDPVDRADESVHGSTVDQGVAQLGCSPKSTIPAALVAGGGSGRRAGGLRTTAELAERMVASGGERLG